MTCARRIITIASGCLAGMVSAGGVVLADNGVPTPSRVVIVIEENHSTTQIIGSPDAPFINALAANGALFTRSYAITHPSQPNYIALFSGSTQGVTDNETYPHEQFTAPNLGAKLLASERGYTFGGYSQTMPFVGFDGDSAGDPPATYERKHNPWVNWQDASQPRPPNKLPPEVNMPFDGYFPADFAMLPTLSIVVPDQLHDMHDGTVAEGDAWLEANLGAYAAWCEANNGLLIITFDEDDFNGDNRIATIFYGPMVRPGAYDEVIDHYTVLRTLEDMFGLPHTAGTLDRVSILDVWAQIPPVCDADVNCDFALDGFDVEAHEMAIGGDMTDFCQPDPDFNGDFALDGFDVEAVEQVVGGGPCP